MDSRRDFLKKAALLTGATGLANVLPASIQKALAINAPEGSTYMDAEHIVLLMQENRSFDHCFGTLKGVRGFNDPRIIDLPNGNKVWLQSNNDGETYVPFHLDIKNTKATWMSSLPHSWANQVNARNDGKFDQWLNEKKNSIEEYSKMPLTLGFHNRGDIPFYYALADAFTVCDQHFCSALTGTGPNRLYFWTGTIREEQNESSRAHVWNDDDDFGSLHWATFPERLEDHGISWKCYQNELSIDVGFDDDQDTWLSNFTDNPFEFFSQYNIQLHGKHIEYLKKRLELLPAEIDALRKKMTALPAGDPHIHLITKELSDKNDELDAIKKNDGVLQPGAFDRLSEREKNLHLKAFVTNQNDPDYHQLEKIVYDDGGIKRDILVPKGDVLHQFRADVNSGKLPTVSWLTAPQSFSDHPSSAWYGAWYVSEVLDILTQNPEVWKKTIFILSYDENDGYFDHVPPFTAPHSHKPGTGAVSKGIDTRVDFVTLEQELERKDFPEKFDKENSIGLGFRVPMVIASPWSKGGWVNSEVFDHTSTLQFLETFLSKKTGRKVTEPNISGWRRMICGNLTSAFRPYHSETIPMPEFLARDTFLESIHQAQFKKLPSDYKLLDPGEVAQLNNDLYSSPYMPQQEPGIKPSCPLPYELYADGRLNAAKTAFEINFMAANKVFGNEALGAPFNVYAPGKYIKKDEPGQFENARNWAYGVLAGDKITGIWPLNEFENSGYHLRVYGPNGFFREFKGDAHDPAIIAGFNYQTALTSSGKLTGNVVITLHNLSGKPQSVAITDHAYKNNNRHIILSPSAKRSLVLDLEKNYGWHDFSVKVSGNNFFEKRYAGHVETGSESYTDPFMGRVIG